MKKVTVSKNVNISKASEVLVSTNAKATTKPETLDIRFGLAEFQIIEAESASKANRTSLPVEFSDSINWPFRTKSFDTGLTVIQVSFNWLKQHKRDDILGSFQAFCNAGHVVTEDIQRNFDSTFTRPGYLYTCLCGVQFVTSYRMIKEASTRRCKCGTLVKDMTCTRQ